MKILEANTTYSVFHYLKDSLANVLSIEQANQKMYSAFGFVRFFDEEEDFEKIKYSISSSPNTILEPNRMAYGDFQTNTDLTNKIASYLKTKNVLPEIIIEPTCGKGSFILASLRCFNKVKKIFGIEIYKPYVWETKFNIIDFYLKNPTNNKPEILIIHQSVFDFDFKHLIKENSAKEILILGNPPWVTNSKLGSLNSSNLPPKINFKNHKGLDAMTGKGNFDIAEYITLMMIEACQDQKGHLALLVKNTVIKNIVFHQFTKKYPISNLEKHCIDSKKEFNASVEAALFYCRLNSNPMLSCSEFDLNQYSTLKLKFGWFGDKFVSNFDAYITTQQIDGKSPFEWRQGIKHDCSAIMELDKVNGHFVNGLKEEIKLENDLVYGMLKSSDLKNLVIKETRKYTIITQKKIGQETKHLEHDFPKTYQYLIRHRDIFNARKSSIYKNKPLFSIFGVGDYSFKPYKVAISGLYKTFHFTLVLPQNHKPIMLDDTCYMLSFDKLEFAVYSLMLLNSKNTTQFLQAITFTDAKRTFTKDVLMRIDLFKLSQTFSKDELQHKLNDINSTYKFDLTLDSWHDFIVEMKLIQNGQMDFFT